MDNLICRIRKSCLYIEGKCVTTDLCFTRNSTTSFRVQLICNCLYRRLMSCAYHVESSAYPAGWWLITFFTSSLLLFHDILINLPFIDIVYSTFPELPWSDGFPNNLFLKQTSMWNVNGKEGHMFDARLAVVLCCLVIPAATLPYLQAQGCISK